MRYPLQKALTFTILITIIFAGIECASGAPPEEQWNKTIGGKKDERIKYAHQTSDGAFIIARMNGSLPFFNKWIEKIDQDGNIQWIKNYEDVDSFQQTSDEGFILAGDKNSDFLMIKLGGISPELKGGDTRSEEIPKETPNMPGFSSLLACSSLLVWIYFVCIRQRMVK